MGFVVYNLNTIFNVSGRQLRCLQAALLFCPKLALLGKTDSVGSFAPEGGKAVAER